MSLEDRRDDMEMCARCSWCKYVAFEQMKSHKYRLGCPSIAYYNFHTYSASGRSAVGLSLVEGRIDYTDKMLDIVYQCQTCGTCDVQCKFNQDIEPLEWMYDTRIKCVEDGQIIPAYILLIDGLRGQDNMMQKPKGERGKWADGLEVKNITTMEAEVYYHAGCRYCFDEELWPSARSAIKLMNKAGVNVGIADKDEVCCGGRAYEMGYEGEAAKYAEHNLEMLKTVGVKTLVTSCADCYWTFKILYDKLGRKLPVEVLHITEYLDRLIMERKLTPNRRLPLTVTYHDPCHMGRMGEPWVRWESVTKKILGNLTVHDPPKPIRRGTHGIYEPPRNILKSIAGLSFVEMERVKENAWCCGAGGGVIDAYPGFAKWTALQRIEEANDTGAEAIVTACPWCHRNLVDAIRESAQKLKIIDIVSLLEQAI